MDWFGIDFDKFTETKEINYNPSFGISYRLRDSQGIWEKDCPITYELASREGLSPDLEFIMGLTRNMIKNSQYGTPEEFSFKLKLVPLGPMNDLETFLHIYMGTTKIFNERYNNIMKAISYTNNVANLSILWGLDHDKKPRELIFNYNFLDIQEPSPRNLKGNELNEFLKSLKA